MSTLLPIYSFNQYILSIYHVPDDVLGSGDTSINKIHKNPCPLWNLDCSKGRKTINKITKIYQYTMEYTILESESW